MRIAAPARPVRRLAGPACPACLVSSLLLLAACGGNASSSSTTTPSWSDPAASQGAGAAADLTSHTCSADAKGSWSFSGVLHNPGSSASTYTITLSLVQKVGSTVKATHSLTRNVAAGATQKVQAAHFLTEKDSKDLQCVVSTRARAAAASSGESSSAAASAPSAPRKALSSASHSA